MQQCLTAFYFPAPIALRTGRGSIALDLTTTAVPPTVGAHRLNLENWHLPTAIVYLFNAALSLSTSDQKRLAQRRTRCLIKSCDISRSSSEEFLCRELR
jgi:hypothetical protein